MVVSKKPARGGQSQQVTKTGAKTKQGKKALSPTMQKWFVHSKGWCLTFLTEKFATQATQAFRSANKDDNFLDNAAPVRVVGKRVFITWARPVVGKTVSGWICNNKALRAVIAPEGKAKAIEWRPWDPSECEAGLNLVEPQEDSATVAYPPLKAPYNTVVALGRSEWFGSEMDQPLAVLNEYGFLCLRGFVPKCLVDPARDTCMHHFLQIIASFTDGHAIDEGPGGLDKVANLPPEVWESKSHGTATKLFQKDLPLGFHINSEGVVLSTDLEGQASKVGVRMGWRVKAINGKMYSPGQDVDFQKSAKKTKQRKPAAGGQAHHVTEINFKQVKLFSPCAIQQKWSVGLNRGYQPQLGLGKCTNPEFFANVKPLEEAQLYMRPWLTVGLG